MVVRIASFGRVKRFLRQRVLLTYTPPSSIGDTVLSEEAISTLKRGEKAEYDVISL